MRSWLFLLIALGWFVAASAQDPFYLYFQSENGNPFYIRLGEKVYSSGPGGYLVFPGLADSTYQLAIGHAATAQGREAKFIVTLKGKDGGYLVDEDADGVVLKDLTAETTLHPLPEAARPDITFEIRSDAFTTQLSRALGDTTLLYVPVFVKGTDLAQKPPVGKTTDTLAVQPVAAVSTDTVASTLPHTAASLSDTTTTGSATVPPVNVATVTSPVDSTHRIASVQADTSVRNVIVTAAGSLVKEPDNLAGKDSLAVIPALVQTPAPKDSVQAGGTDTAGVAKEAAPPAVEEPPYRKSVVRRHSESSTSEGFGLVILDDTGESIDTIRLVIPNPRMVFAEPDTSDKDAALFLEIPREKLVAKDSTVAAVPRNACKNEAGEKDFFRLRKGMAGKDSDEAMVAEAAKAFRSRCYTTEQIRNLSVLFLTAAGKYQFFEAAQAHISDPERFTTLQSELKDDHYFKRFKLLVGE